MSAAPRNDSNRSIDGGSTRKWQLQDMHTQNMSFSFVRPVDVRVRSLGVQVDVDSSPVDVVKGWFTTAKVGDNAARRKKILSSVSADFPRGSLSAIIGGSGSGKVSNIIFKCFCSF
jgi:ABC-type glutathione transport system ATPase component